MYGKRCNFIHVHSQLEATDESAREDIEMRVLRGQGRRQSVLLSLLTSN